ncbi:MAG TPA: VOC family protein [Chryseosolibacter sp.]|nr:VOC family protein [Chryseosolibacter sp.]
MTSGKISTSITPMLSVRNGAAALDFYQQGFGATVVDRFDGPNGRLIIGELFMDGVKFFVSEEAPELGNVAPEKYNSTTVRLELTIEDPDGFVERAVAAGARIVFPVADQDYGWRQGRIIDPFGHQWVVGRPIQQHNS